jgi:serine/threonine protein kinase
MSTGPPPGAELGGYRIESILGRGGMGVVYLAEHIRLKRKVALKVLPSELAEDQRFRDRFLRESELAASLDDPNIIPIYEAGEHDGVLFIAMRYVQGHDLKTLLEQEGALELDRIVDIVGQVASALDAAHGKGLVHRDVKPGNILVAPRTGGSVPTEQVYLTDFGLTKRAASDSGLTGTGVFVGSLSYAAPEQFEGGALDGRTDVYSLGCVLFESLTGAPPFRREQDAALMHAHLHERPPSASGFRPELPPAVDRVVERAMAKRPDQRYPTAGGLADALRDAVAGAGDGRPPSRWRTRAWLIAAAALIALGTIIIVLAVTGGNGDPGTSPTASGAPSGEAPVPASLTEIDPETGVAALSVPGISGLGATANADPSLAVGEGGVWAITWPLGGRPSLFSIDETTGAIRDRIAILPPSFGGAALAVGSRTIWFIGGEELGSVSRVNPATLDPIASVRVHGGEVTDIVLGDDVLWAGSDVGTLTGFDALTGTRLTEIDLDASPDELAYGADSVWALDQLASQVVQIDPEGGVVRRIDVGGNLEDVAAGDGGVWVLDDLAGTVVQIDPETGALGDPVRVGPEPSAIAVGLGAAWVTDAQEPRIFRVDPQVGGQEPIDVGAPLVAIAVDEANDALWVAVLDT